MGYGFFMLVGIVGGIAAAIQGPFTGVMGRTIGDVGSVFFTYGGGGLLIALIVLLSGGSSLSGWRELPWYVFLAGPLGLVIIGSLSFTVPRLGAVVATALFILSWLCFSAVVDQFGLFGVEARTVNPSRLLGIAALIIGTYLVSK